MHRKFPSRGGESEHCEGEDRKTIMMARVVYSKLLRGTRKAEQDERFNFVIAVIKKNSPRYQPCKSNISEMRATV